MKLTKKMLGLQDYIGTVEPLHLEGILAAMPRDQSVAACLHHLEGWKLTEAEAEYMRFIANDKVDRPICFDGKSRIRTEDQNDCYFEEECDSEDEKKRMRAWVEKVRTTIKEL